MLYLAALVFGLGAFVVQMLSPGDTSDAGDGGGPASILLSLRFYMFAALGFGILEGRYSAHRPRHRQREDQR